jgi:hypothetical protein
MQAGAERHDDSNNNTAHATGDVGGFSLKFDEILAGGLL